MILCDASVLVALINRGDSNHARCLDILDRISDDLVTTWPCFTEAMHLLGRYGGWTAQQTLWSYVSDEILRLHLHENAERNRIYVLMEQYRDIPMDLADASLVATAEELNLRMILTLDRDFYIYRIHDIHAFEVLP